MTGKLLSGEWVWRMSGAGGDYYAGPLDTQATLIQAGYVTASTSGNDTRAVTSAAGNTALADYLNAQYDAGATAGDYVFLRANMEDSSAAGTLPIVGFNTADLAPYIANAYGDSVDRYLPQFSPGSM